METLNEEDGDLATAIGNLETMWVPLMPEGEMGA